MIERQLAFFFLVAAAFGVFGFSVSRYVLVLMRGREHYEPIGSWPARVADVVRYFFMQLSVAREKASWHHLAIFWGFLVITVGTVEILVNGLVPALSLAALSPTIDMLFKGLLDVTNAVVLATIGYAFYRRAKKRRPLIRLSGDAALILGMIAGLCLTHFLAHGFGMVAEDGISARFREVPFGPASYRASMPFSGLVFLAFRPLDPHTAHLISGVSYWLHVVVILFFLNYLPYSKHIHLLGALPNILLRNRGQRGVLPKIDLEDQTQWGVGRYEQFSWKQLLDSYACTECARCSNACPAMATDKPLSPMHLVLGIKDELATRGEHLLRLSAPAWNAVREGDLDAAEHPVSRGDRALLDELAAMPPMVGGRIKEETLWSCTTCGACEAECPVFIEHPLKIMQMRTHLVLEQGKQPAELARMFRGIENNQNPWGIGADKRMDWAADIDVPVMAEKGRAEYLLWVGCAGSFDDRGKKITRDWVALLQQAGVDFAVLGDEEGCTGDAARRAGNEFLFQAMAEANIETLARYDVRKILVSCPHCYHSFKNEYPRFGGHYEVWHHSQFLQQLLAQGKLKPTQKVSGRVAYHDPCYLGRWNGEYDDARTVVAIATQGGHDGSPLELPRNRNKSFCCGAGGSRFWVEEESPRVNVVRTKEAIETGADVIATACPFCNVMLGDGTKQLDQDEHVSVQDIAQLLAQATAAKPHRKNPA